MADANAAVPGVLQPWGGPRGCDGRSECLLDEHGNALPPVKVVCASFDMPELHGDYCSCDYAFTRAGPACSTPTPTSSVNLVMNLVTGTLDVILLVLVLRKVCCARSMGKIRVGTGLAVTLLGMTTLALELTHSVCRAIAVAGAGGVGAVAMTRFAGMSGLVAPGMALILSFAAWVKLARGLGKRKSQVWLERALALTSVVFFVWQIRFGFHGRVDIAVWASALVMGVLAIVYPASGFVLILQLSARDGSVPSTNANQTAVRLRAFVVKVTVLTALATVCLVLLAQSMQVVGIKSFEIEIAPAVLIVVIKCIYGLMAYVLSSFTLDVIISAHKRASTGAAVDPDEDIYRAKDSRIAAPMTLLTTSVLVS